MHKWLYGFGIFTWISGIVFSRSTWLTEVLYFKFVFRILRYLYDYTLGFLPFASIYIIYFSLIYLLFWSIYRWSKVDFRFDNFFNYLYRLGSYLVLFGSLFYWSWGFNYNRSSIDSHLGLYAQKIEPEMLISQSMHISQQMLMLKEKISQDSFYIPPNMETIIRAGLADLIVELDYPAYGSPRVRLLRPTGSLLHLSTAGVYLPFAFEGHIDAGLHPIQYPFTMAHEMSHAYGFTDEAGCNFLGYLACLHTDDLHIQYSGLMGYWRYVLSDIKYNYPDAWKEHWPLIDQSLKDDIQDIRVQMDKFPDILPKLRDLVYDTYLKSHGVQEGLKSYSRVVELVSAWESKKEREKN